MSALLRMPPHWTALARCAEVDPAPFFPGKGESTKPAKKVCAGCEVRVTCLEYALSDPELDGVWGGTSTRERQRIRSAQAVTAAVITSPPAGEKTCTGCGLVKPLAQFSADPHGADGRKYRCKACVAARRRERLVAA